MLVHLDIETLPTTDPEVIAEFAAKIAPPGNIKKTESVAAWMEENKEFALAEMVAKTSFDGMYGRIACICYAIDDGDVHSFADDDESSLLRSFYSDVMTRTATDSHNEPIPAPLTFVGHNLAAFDLPFIRHRSIINKVRPPAPFLKAFAAKPWGAEIADTMLMWSDPHKRGGMDRICKALGIPGKGDFDGSMVAATWPVDPQRVIDYCKDDVRRTREMYKRMTFSGGPSGPSAGSDS